MHAMLEQGLMTRRAVESLPANSYQATISGVKLQSDAKLENCRYKNCLFPISSPFEHDLRAAYTSVKFIPQRPAALIEMYEWVMETKRPD
jgi:hypothetical protein